MDIKKPALLREGGGSTGARTPDLLIKSQLLYQLSYASGVVSTQTKAGRQLEKRKISRLGSLSPMFRSPETPKAARSGHRKEPTFDFNPAPSSSPSPARDRIRPGCSTSAPGGPQAQRMEALGWRRPDRACRQIIPGSNFPSDAPRWTESLRPGDVSRVNHSAQWYTLQKLRAAQLQC